MAKRVKEVVRPEYKGVVRHVRSLCTKFETDSDDLIDVRVLHAHRLMRDGVRSGGYNSSYHYRYAMRDACFLAVIKFHDEASILIGGRDG